MQVQIRDARPGEEQKLLPLYEWLFEPPGRRPARWDPKLAAMALREAIESHDSSVLVAETQHGEAAGICIAYRDINSVRFGHRVWVEDLAVRPDLRSRGIGGRLLAAASDWARERGATHFELDTGTGRADARRFYERLRPDHEGVSYTWEL